MKEGEWVQNGRIGLLFIGLHEWKDRSPVYWIA